MFSDWPISPGDYHGPITDLFVLNEIPGLPSQGRRRLRRRSRGAGQHDPVAAGGEEAAGEGGGGGGAQEGGRGGGQAQPGEGEGAQPGAVLAGGHGLRGTRAAAGQLVQVCSTFSILIQGRGEVIYWVKKVRCLFCFEICNPEGRGKKSEIMQMSKLSTQNL